MLLDSSYDLVYLFSNKKQNSELLHEPIDIKITYKKESITVKEMPSNIEEYNGQVTEELLYLTLLSGHHSRFKKDFRLSSNYEKFYTTWIQKSVDREISDKVLVFKVSDKIVGFITLKVLDNCVQVGLIAVHDNHWGKGIGSSLLKAISFVYPNKKIMVSTQEKNMGANSLYIKNGFSIDKKQYIYHLWK